MKRVQLFFSALLLCSFIGCSQKPQTTAPAPTPDANAQVALPQPSASVSGSVSASVAGGVAVKSSVPENVKKPMSNPALTPGKDGKPAQMPPGMDRMYRALTLEEINQLPPATREMILKAQGRWTPSPAPKK
jgi:hypothetical protein